MINLFKGMFFPLFTLVFLLNFSDVQGGEQPKSFHVFYSNNIEGEYDLCG